MGTATPDAPAHPRPHRRAPTGPQAAANASPCTAEQLTFAAEIDGAAGTTFNRITLTSKEGTQPCRLEGQPTVDLGIDPPTVHVPISYDPAGEIYRHPVLVGDGHAAQLRLAWSNWCSTPVRNTNVSISLADSGGTITAPGFGNAPPCLITGGTGPSSIFIYSFEPSDQTGKIESAYHRVAVTISALPAGAKAGETVNFEVTMQAHGRAVRLNPCPDYSIAQTMGGPWATHHFGLNCDGVRTRTRQGQPILEPGVPLTFAMQAKLLAAPNHEKLRWQLTVPDAESGAGLAE